MRVLRALGRFLHDFVVGDDWRLPAGIIACLAVAALLLAARVPSEAVAVGTAGAIAAWFSLCLLRDVTRR